MSRARSKCPWEYSRCRIPWTYNPHLTPSSRICLVHLTTLTWVTRPCHKPPTIPTWTHRKLLRHRRSSTIRLRPRRHVRHPHPPRHSRLLRHPSHHNRSSTMVSKVVLHRRPDRHTQFLSSSSSNSRCIPRTGKTCSSSTSTSMLSALPITSRHLVPPRHRAPRRCPPRTIIHKGQVPLRHHTRHLPLLVTLAPAVLEAAGDHVLNPIHPWNSLPPDYGHTLSPHEPTRRPHSNHPNMYPSINHRSFSFKNHLSPKTNSPSLSRTMLSHPIHLAFSSCVYIFAPLRRHRFRSCSLAATVPATCSPSAGLIALLSIVISRLWPWGCKNTSCAFPPRLRTSCFRRVIISLLIQVSKSNLPFTPHIPSSSQFPSTSETGFCFLIHTLRLLLIFTSFP